MGLFSRSKEYTEQTTGVIVGVSAVKVNNMNLPLAEYEVEGKQYRVRVPYGIAVKLERQSEGEGKLVRANLNYGNVNVRLQHTKIQGCKVNVLYNPQKPKKAKVVD